MKTRKPLISDKSVNEQEHFHYFSITAPVFDKGNNVNGFVMVQIRIDYMENVLSILTPDHSVKVENKERETIMEINSDYKQPEDDTWVTIPLDEASWRLHVKVHPDMETFDYKPLIGGLAYGTRAVHNDYSRK